MGNALHLLVNLDHDAVRATSELRWSPAIHFWLDVLAGAALGVAIGALIAIATRRSMALRLS